MRTLDHGVLRMTVWIPDSVAIVTRQPGMEYKFLLFEYLGQLSLQELLFNFLQLYMVCTKSIYVVVHILLLLKKFVWSRQ